jgi:PPOX class probable F420-dependent enzyme
MSAEAVGELGPAAERPYMPGYGVLAPDEGTGLLPWSWAEERLGTSKDFWLVTVRPDGRPHAMPVWGVWWTGSFWFTCGRRSRKARNLAEEPRCTVTSEDTQEPVVIEGVAEVVTEPGPIAALVEVLNAKYGGMYSVDFLDPEVNATIRVRPERAFGIAHDDFTGSPTRWTFAEGSTEESAPDL